VHVDGILWDVLNCVIRHRLAARRRIRGCERLDALVQLAGTLWIDRRTRGRRCRNQKEAAIGNYAPAGKAGAKPTKPQSNQRSTPDPQATKEAYIPSCHRTTRARPLDLGVGGAELCVAQRLRTCFGTGGYSGSWHSKLIGAFHSGRDGPALCPSPRRIPKSCVGVIDADTPSALHHDRTRPNKSPAVSALLLWIPRRPKQPGIRATTVRASAEAEGPLRPPAAARPEKGGVAPPWARRKVVIDFASSLLCRARGTAAQSNAERREGCAIFVPMLSATATSPRDAPRRVRRAWPGRLAGRDRQAHGRRQLHLCRTSSRAST
jgi:hypothetical protein